MENKIYKYNNNDNNTPYDFDLIKNNSSNIVHGGNYKILTRFIFSNLFGYRIVIVKPTMYDI